MGQNHGTSTQEVIRGPGAREQRGHLWGSRSTAEWGLCGHSGQAGGRGVFLAPEGSCGLCHFPLGPSHLPMVQRERLDTLGAADWPRGPGREPLSLVLPT